MNGSLTSNVTTKSARKVATVLLEAVTKGAVRYQEVDKYDHPIRMMNPLCLIGTLYLRQHKLADWNENGNFPNKLRITIEVVE